MKEMGGRRRRRSPSVVRNNERRGSRIGYAVDAAFTVMLVREGGSER
jgi:hypothetical protein